MYGDPRGLDFKDATLVDKLVVEHFNMLYLKGFQSYKEVRLVAAILHFYPEYGRGGNLKLPRAGLPISSVVSHCCPPSTDGIPSDGLVLDGRPKLLC